MVLAEREHVEPDAVSELDLRHRLGERPLDMDRPPRRRVALGLDEGVDAELHGLDPSPKRGIHSSRALWRPPTRSATSAKVARALGVCRLAPRAPRRGPFMPPMISASDVTKTYASGFTALENVNLEIVKGEIFALLGPNGAGKTSLIGVICGIVSMTSGRVLVDGHDIEREYRAARSKLGLVPQEIALDIFSTVWNTVRFSRRLFGRRADDRYVESLLRDLSLWEKRDSRIVELSGGMKRRVMIAKALSHEPDAVFLDEPTAGVDVNLRRDMWALVRRLRDKGVTVILTTHYIEEAEEMADRVGVIDNGRLVLVEDKTALMRKLGKRRLILTLHKPLSELPASLAGWPLELDHAGLRLTYAFNADAEGAGISRLLERLGELGIDFRDLETSTSTLEDIFIDLVGRSA
jgi:ABC-2 type transport system ATP-binding protein